ncbi:MAG: DNA polymerase III subunit delta [Bacteroidales bacterium]|nr:DNA polymerase III subunit delta [Bacteroidales bacterium]
MNFDQIVKDIDNQVFYPVYFLMGDEPYYIDKISNLLASKILTTDEEREMNLIILYGGDTNVQTIVSYARSYGMIPNYQVIIIKEAKNLDDIEKLESYIENPSKTSILVICYKYGTIDKRKTIAKKIEKMGVLFESKPLYDDKIPEWVSTLVINKGLRIGPNAALLLSENIGNDLSRIESEINKMTILLPKGSEITVEDIERNIGISKEFNVFELQKALTRKDILKANRIIKYFAQNPKNNPMLQVLAILYSFFCKILIFHTIKDKNDIKLVASTLSVNPFFVKDYTAASRTFPVSKLEKIFEYLRDADMKCKGIESNMKDEDAIYKELIFKIMH